MEEGGVRIEDTVLFGKYRICRVIGSGRVGTVFLAIHSGLEEYRAIKRVAKDNLAYEQFRKEALILKELHHSGIPTVYDLEEDSIYSYLIEEYLEGDSLYDLASQPGFLSKANIIRYGIQICHIVNHLHSAGTFPILYLDLQPKNLLLCHETIKLIDFDHAASVADANASRKRYGTIGCAAPEQYTCEPLDERTDIYAIGVILHYLGTGTYPCETSSSLKRTWGSELAAIINTCLSTNKEDRFQSAMELCERLERLEGCQAGVFKQSQSSPLIIALTGSKSGVGVTHLSIGLSVYLKKQGFPNVYEEKNQSGTVLELGTYFGAETDQKGLLCVKGCVFKPYYGSCVKLEDHPYQIIIQDYGSNYWEVKEGRAPDLILLLCGGMWWDLEASRKAVNSLLGYGQVNLIFPHHILDIKLRIPAEFKDQTCYLMPHFPNPFQANSQTDEFYNSILHAIKRRERGGAIRRIKEKVQNIRKKIGGL